eukprot:5542340-Pleurochrysis_carterae.AAC.1
MRLRADAGGSRSWATVLPGGDLPLADAALASAAVLTSVLRGMACAALYRHSIIQISYLGVFCRWRLTARASHQLYVFD